MSVIEIFKQAFSGNHRAQANGKGKRIEDNNSLYNTSYYFYRDEDWHRYFLSLVKGRTFKKQDK